jgi:SAM-dependent methyltransferase
MNALLKRSFYLVYYPASVVWRKLDRMASWKENQWWIDHTPGAIFTSATYASYAGWMHNQGLFSALFSVYLDKDKPKILDFGCGMGSLATVSSFFVKNGGQFLGIDTDERSIAACKKTHGDLKNCSFYLTRDRNAWYPQTDGRGTTEGIDWPVEKNSQDLVTAMSVFTHLQERDAKDYLAKIHEVLVKDGLAILSFLVVRDFVNANPTFHFNHPLTPGWFTSNPACPEMAIGVTQEALLKFLDGKFKIVRQLEGSITGGKHPSHQDLLVLRKI